MAVSRQETRAFWMTERLRQLGIQASQHSSRSHATRPHADMQLKSGHCNALCNIDPEIATFIGTRHPTHHQCTSICGQVICRNRVSANEGPSPHQLAPLDVDFAGPPGANPAAIAGATYLRTVLRSTPRLSAISLSDQPACQCTKISVISTTLNVLLANPGSHHLTRWEQPSTCKDHTSHDTPHHPVGNYVNTTLGNSVNADIVKDVRYTTVRAPLSLIC
ncbi:hypothetical protein [Mycobacterium haemophilum]